MSFLCSLPLRKCPSDFLHRCSAHPHVYPAITCSLSNAEWTTLLSKLILDFKKKNFSMVFFKSDMVPCTILFCTSCYSLSILFSIKELCFHRRHGWIHRIVSDRFSDALYYASNQILLRQCNVVKTWFKTFLKEIQETWEKRHSKRIRIGEQARTTHIHNLPHPINIHTQRRDSKLFYQRYKKHGKKTL